MQMTEESIFLMILIPIKTELLNTTDGFIIKLKVSFMLEFYLKKQTQSQKIQPFMESLKI